MVIKRKWQFIEDQVKDLDALLASIARDIDWFLEFNYGSEHTPDWIENYETLKKLLEKAKSEVGKLRLIGDIALESSYCTACDKSRSKLNKLLQEAESSSSSYPWDICELCPLAEMNFECSDDRSLYAKFLLELERSIMRKQL